MKTVHSVAELRQAVGEARRNGASIGFVPTMGNLHAGHISLIERARQQCGFVVASVFVNPLQFGPNEDLATYPRTLAADQEKLEEAGCDLLFAPSVDEMYPRGMTLQTVVSVPAVSEGLCGASRPGHFDGVSTVVSKLFNMVQPDVAVFGQKDYQQLAVIRAMVRDLDIPVQIIGQPTARAEDGLALSSRNGYLTEQERATAPAIYRTLQGLGQSIESGQQDFAALIARGLGELQAAGLRPDYLEIRDADTLGAAQPGSARLVLVVAAHLGMTRLLDNLVVERRPC